MHEITSMSGGTPEPHPVVPQLRDARRISPGDHVLLILDRGFTHEQIATLEAQWRAALPDVPVTIVAGVRQMYVKTQRGNNHIDYQARILDALRHHGPLMTSLIHVHTRGSAGPIQNALWELEQTGQVIVTKGAKGARIYHLPNGETDA
jgi:hypothetical protein